MSTSSVELLEVTKTFRDPQGKTITAVDDVSLQIADGEFFALLGPSGCGKTTTLRTVAGFEQPTSGKVLIRGEAVQGIPPFHRPVNTVFQDYALFPHMSVLDNVMFGLRMAKVSKKEAKERALDLLELVQLPHAASRKPAQLSGGQQQRVALARALVNKPAVLLLDEPLGALDLKLRQQMQLELKTMQREVGVTFIFVTHDQEEAMTMADRIAVMKGGRVLQVGRADEIYEAPADRFVADFIGETNFIEGKLQRKDGDSGVLELSDGRRLEGRFKGHALDVAVGERVSVAVRPEKIALQTLNGSASDESSSSNTTVLEAEVAEALYIGTDTRYRVVSGSDVDLAVRVQNLHHGFSAMLKEGDKVRVSWQNENATLLS